MLLVRRLNMYITNLHEIWRFHYWAYHWLEIINIFISDVLWIWMGQGYFQSIFISILDLPRNSSYFWVTPLWKISWCQRKAHCLQNNMENICIRSHYIQWSTSTISKEFWLYFGKHSLPSLTHLTVYPVFLTQRYKIKK